MVKKLFTSIEDENPFKKLYSWISPERHWVKKERGWYISYSLFFVILIAFLAMLQEYLLILAVLAFVFLWFVQGATPPQIIEHTITSLGIRTFDTFYKWRDIKHFWFSKKSGIIYLNLETVEDSKPDLTKRICLLVNDNQDEDIFKILILHLDYGDKKEIGYSPILQLLHGEYFNSDKYLEDQLTESLNN